MLRVCLGLVLVLFSAKSMAMSHWDPEWESLPNFDADAVSHFIERPDGAIIHYTTLGEGPPVLMIHGYYATGDANWHRNGIAAELAKTNKVIAMDQRGHGKSSKYYTSKYYGANMWKDAVAILDNEKVDKVHLHGYSMGGSIVTQILYYMPERVLSATYGGSGIAEQDEEEKKNIVKDIEPTQKAKDEEDAAQDVVVDLTDPDHLALQALSRNPPLQDEDKLIDLTQIQIPVLSINGEFDYPNTRTHRMARELKDYRAIVLPEKGHLTSIVPGYMPPEYLNETVNFIRQVDQKLAGQP